LADAARAWPAREALFQGRACVADYASFDTRARSVAGWLQQKGIAPGDRVAICMKNHVDFLVVLYGIWYVGAVAVPINAKLHPREVAFILQDSGAGVVFASDRLAEGMPGDVVPVPGTLFDAALAAPCVDQIAAREAGDLAWLFYTSGTTGRPKGVMITHGMLASMARSYLSDVDDVRAEDAALYAAPLSHGAGLYALMHVKAAARHVCPESGGFDPGEIFDLSAHFGSVHMFAAPTMVKRMTDAAKLAGLDGEGLRTIVYAGGPMYNADIIEAVDHFGSVFVQIYGQGECPMGITALSRSDVSERKCEGWQERLASVGKAQSGIELRVGDADGQAVPVGISGEIMVRGATVMPGYWQNETASAAALQGGWLRTGDIGFLNGEGYLTLQDRSKDMIITGGSNVYPREVEEVLLQHKRVSEVSVVGRAHPEWGEEIVAFIVGDATEAELDALCLAEIARFKRPKAYLRLEALPKNNYGKVLKTELRKLL
jgi:long-chain acyl-CoA synthetase